MAEAYRRITAHAAERLCTRIFETVGVPAADARTVTDNLVQAELRGIPSHGLLRVRIYCERIRDGLVNPHPTIRTLNEKPAMLHLDGDNGLGAVVGTAAMDMCLSRASRNGACFCTVRKANHFGIAAFYSMRASEAGMIGLAMQNSPPAMAPWGGIAPLIGTNPLSYAVPAGRHDPIVFDGATSRVARGKINLAQAAGRNIPEGWALDRSGRATTDAAQALAGSLLPFGEYKGYGIALLIDIMSGILSGANHGSHIGSLWNNQESMQNLGMTFAAFDIGAFSAPDIFIDRIDTMIDEIKASSRVEGVEEILVPGEIEFRNVDRYRREGIPVGPGVLADLEKLTEELGLKEDLASLLD